MYRGTNLVTTPIQIHIIQGGEAIPPSLGVDKDNQDLNSPKDFKIGIFSAIALYKTLHKFISLKSVMHLASLIFRIKTIKFNSYLLSVLVHLRNSKLDW